MLRIDGGSEFNRVEYNIYTGKEQFNETYYYYIIIITECAISVGLSVKSDQMKLGPIKTMAFTGLLSGNIKH